MYQVCFKGQCLDFSHDQHHTNQTLRWRSSRTTSYTIAASLNLLRVLRNFHFTRNQRLDSVTVPETPRKEYAHPSLSLVLLSLGLLSPPKRKASSPTLGNRLPTSSTSQTAHPVPPFFWRPQRNATRDRPTQPLELRPSWQRPIGTGCLFNAVHVSLVVR